MISFSGKDNKLGLSQRLVLIVEAIVFGMYVEAVMPQVDARLTMLQAIGLENRKARIIIHTTEISLRAIAINLTVL